MIGDLSDATALYMPQNISQEFTAGGTDTAIALDQINSLVANNLAAKSAQLGLLVDLRQRRLGKRRRSRR